MAAHGSWRVSFSASAGSSYFQLAELVLLDGAGNDVSVGGVAGASSVFSAVYGAANAFDRNPATEWATAGSDFPARIWYTAPTPIDVRRLRFRWAASANFLPRSLADISLSSSDDGGASWSLGFAYRLSLVSGTLTAGTELEMAVEPADLSGLAPMLSLPGYAQGRPPTRYASADLVPAPVPLARDYRQQGATTGTITDRVMFKATPSSPESPFAMGRIWLMRLADGYKAWEGWSNAAGYYTATGLELDVDYIAVGIDPNRNHKATGAGPVRAVEAV